MSADCPILTIFTLGKQGSKGFPANSGFSNIVTYIRGNFYPITRSYKSICLLPHLGHSVIGTLVINPQS